jgi:hypothetical protein
MEIQNDVVNEDAVISIIINKMGLMGINEKVLANALEVSKSELSSYLSGECEFPASVLYLISIFLFQDPAYLLDCLHTNICA